MAATAGVAATAAPVHASLGTSREGDVAPAAVVVVAERGEGALTKAPGDRGAAVSGFFEGAELVGTVAGVDAPDRLEGAYTWAASRWLQHIQKKVSFSVGSGSSAIECIPPRCAVGFDDIGRHFYVPEALNKVRQ